MRISDWSSDVCSSDLRDPFPIVEMEDVAAGKFGNSVYLAVEILRRDDTRHVAAIRILKALILDTGRQVVRLRCGAAHVANPGTRMPADAPLGEGIGPPARPVASEARGESM